MTMYFITPNYSFAFIPKVGCSSLARVVIRQFQPKDNTIIINGHYPEGLNAENSKWQSIAQREHWPSKPIVALIRDPIERFKSAMSQMHFSDVDAAIDSLKNGTLMQCFKRKTKLMDNGHFKPQIMWVDETTKLYKFPDHIQNALNEVGIEGSIPVINQCSFPKPQLTTEQRLELEIIYQEDIALYNAITSPGIVTGIVSPNRPQKPETPPVEE